jgi:Beta-propeller repeat
MGSSRTTKLRRAFSALVAASFTLSAAARASEALPRGLSFEPNYGQFAPGVGFVARGKGYDLILGEDGARLRFVGAQAGELGLSLVGGAMRIPAGLEPEAARYNYLVGPDASRWRTGVESYAKAAYSDALPGVDWVFYGHSQRELEYDFVVKPGARVADIAVRLTGARNLRVDGDGWLRLELSSGGRVEQKPPIAYQLDARGRRSLVASRYDLRTDGTLGFVIGHYDASRPLVIDPQLSYSTYFGGSGFEDAKSVAIDAQGAVYFAGSTSAGLFPIVGALQPAYGGGSTDAFVCKLNTAGSAIVYATFIGGADADVATGIAVDAGGNAYISGYTLSTNFPTVSAAQPASGGLTDGFVVKLNATGSALLHASYLGGSADDYANGIAVSAGSARVVGTTSSTNFPTVLPWQSGLGGGTDAFVSYFNPAGSALSFSTYLGGASTDVGSGVALDSTGAAFVVGSTSSNGFPTVSAFQPTFAGGAFDAFIARISAVGGVTSSSYLGGADRDEATSVAVDVSGAAYVAGLTTSNDLPGVGAGVQSTRAGAFDAFASKVAAGNIVASTYLGGTGNDRALGIAVDNKGAVFLAGYTDSTAFPTLLPNQATSGGGNDAFLAKLGSLTELIYSTYFGGSGNDRGFAIASDAVGAVALAGITTSSNFPTQPGAVYPSRIGSQDAFVLKVPAATAKPAPAGDWISHASLACLLAALVIAMSRRVQMAS